MGRGRPTDFKEEFIEQARVACADLGATDEKLAKLFGVHRDTIYEWRKQHPKFEEAIRKGKDEFDSGKVEKALYKRATGIRFTETTREPCIIRKKNETAELVDLEMSVTKKISKLIPADPTSMIFWLKNRQPERWKDVKAIEASGPSGGPISIEGGLTNLEAATKLAFLLEQALKRKKADADSSAKDQ